MVKYLLILVIFWWLGWIIRRTWRRLIGRSPGKPGRRVPPRRPANGKDSLSNRTQQEISDADYEEIP